MISECEDARSSLRGQQRGYVGEWIGPERLLGGCNIVVTGNGKKENETAHKEICYTLKENIATPKWVHCVDVLI